MIWLSGWLVAFLTTFTEVKRPYVGFLQVFMLAFFSFENLVKGSITKMRTIGETSRSALGIFKTIKHDTRDNPSAVNCTSNAQK